MHHKVPDDILIRNTLRPGDLGYIIYLHGLTYAKEYQYGLEFESYVAAGLHEFYNSLDITRDGIWIAEHNERIIGSLFLAHRGERTAQLRYFLIDPAWRGKGIGTELMGSFMQFLKQGEYNHAFLWTTSDLKDAASLYRKCGFRLTEEKNGEIFGRPVIEQKYEWWALS